MISDRDRMRLADLALRAIDTIVADYGDNAELTAATLVFEVKVRDETDDDESLFHANYKSLPGNSPHHIAGLLAGTAAYIQAPSDDGD